VGRPATLQVMTGVPLNMAVEEVPVGAVVRTQQTVVPHSLEEVPVEQGLVMVALGGSTLPVAVVLVELLLVMVGMVLLENLVVVMEGAVKTLILLT